MTATARCCRRAGSTLALALALAACGDKDAAPVTQEGEAGELTGRILGRSVTDEMLPVETYGAPADLSSTSATIGPANGAEAAASERNANPPGTPARTPARSTPAVAPPATAAAEPAPSAADLDAAEQPAPAGATDDAD